MLFYSFRLIYVKPIIKHYYETFHISLFIDAATLAFFFFGFYHFLLWSVRVGKFILQPKYYQKTKKDVIFIDQQLSYG